MSMVITGGKVTYMKIYTSLDQRLRTQHLTLAEIINKVSAERMVLRPAPEKWNIHDNIAHLTKYQITFIERITRILYEDVPNFDRYKAEDDPSFKNFVNKNEDDFLASLSEQRITIINLVCNLAEKELERIGVHNKFGPLNIVEWSEFFVLHEAHHLFTIFQLATDTRL